MMTQSFLSSTYTRLPVSFTHGEGVWLYDTLGNRYLDALSGIAVSTLGHAHPALVKAIANQAGRLIHTSNLFQVPEQEVLAEKLVAISGMQEVFFSNSGAEANEAAIKLSRLLGNNKGYQNPSIIVFEHAFHGRTLSTLSATGNSKVQKGFAPLVKGFYRVPLGDLSAVEQVINSTPEIVAVMIEPIQGEGGIWPIEPTFLQGLRKICDTHELLLMLDEVQCGMGRTGDWFAFQSSGIVPDVLMLAKGIAGGVPMGACLMAGIAHGLFKTGNHGSTFGGNPLACSASLAVINTIEQEGLLANVKTVGDKLRVSLIQAFADKGAKVRGRGLMIGIEWPTPLPHLAKIALEHRLILNVTHDKVIRLLPPLIFKEEHIPHLISALSQSLAEHPQV